jgi:hypothetical protein
MLSGYLIVAVFPPSPSSLHVTASVISVVIVEQWGVCFAFSLSLSVVLTTEAAGWGGGEGAHGFSFSALVFSCCWQ